MIGDGTGTITQDYLPKMNFDKKTDLHTTLPDPKKKKGPINYDESDSSEDNEGTGKS